MPYYVWCEGGRYKAQSILDTAVQEGGLLKVDPGIQAEVVYWDGSTGAVSGFDRQGNQVGFGQVVYDRDPRGMEKALGFMSYLPAYVVATGYEGQGIASAMMKLMEEHAATNNAGAGASFFYDVQAETPEKQQAAQRLIDKTGAVKIHSNPDFYTRILLKSRDFKRMGGKQGVFKLPSEDIATFTHYKN